MQTATRVWDCSIVLSKWLEARALTHPLDFAQKRAIEVGAGTGFGFRDAHALSRISLLGMAFAVLSQGLESNGTAVTLTDVAAAVPALERNVELTFGRDQGIVSAKTLDWTDSSTLEALSPPFDVILASDVVWVQDLIAPLVQTIDALSSPTSCLYLCHQSRSVRGDTEFFSRLGESWSMFGITTTLS